MCLPPPADCFPSLVLLGHQPYLLGRFSGLRGSRPWVYCSLSHTHWSTLAPQSSAVPGGRQSAIAAHPTEAGPRPAFPSCRDPRVRSDSRCKGRDEPSSPAGLPALRMGPQPASPSELLASLSCFRQSWPVPPTLCCPESPRASVPLHPPGSTPRKYFSPTTK